MIVGKLTQRVVGKLNKLTTRKAHENEISSIQAIAREVILARYPAFLGEEAVTAFIGSGQSDREFVEHRDNLYVLAEGDRLIGFTICFDAFVHLMMIKLDVQGNGFGSHLLEWCEGVIGGKGHKIARLETFLSNAQAVNFYLKNGWSEVERDSEDAGAFARICFQKSLGYSSARVPD